MSTPEIQQIPQMFGTTDIDDAWSLYGLSEHTLSFNGKDIGKKAIVKENNLISIVSKDYVLLPNEVAIQAADTVARDVGAVPFSEYDGEWYAKLSNHVIETKEGNQIHALYAFNEPVEITPGDTIQLGFGVHNSIDASMGFGAGLFTFRHACANMVFMGFKGTEMAFDNRKTLSWLYNKHVGNFSPDPGKLQTNIMKVMDQGLEVIKTYRKMSELALQEEAYKRLIKGIPQKYLPDNLKAEMPTAEMLKGKTLWEGYNDVTAGIWHNQDTVYVTKKILFDRLHTNVTNIMAPTIKTPKVRARIVA